MKVKTLHIFNPEHDIALAANLANFTAPHAGRQLRGDLGFLPALWADAGDAVLVDDRRRAELRYNRLRGRLGRDACCFVEPAELSRLEVEHVEPWGWDLALLSLLKRKGVGADVLPDADYISRLRQLSHRRTSAALLQQLQTDGTVGQATECCRVEQVAELVEQYGQAVLKAPWSSSGRGVRFVTSATARQAEFQWLSNVLQRQGSIMVEPYYNKIKDFGVEFEAAADGIRCVGLSLFHTRNGAYTGNVLATERAKREALGRYLSMDLLDQVCHRITSVLNLGDYRGPFGVDMMVVKDADASSRRLLLHPCVELNLRRTMGHVALALTTDADNDELHRVMRIRFEDNRYRLSVSKCR